MHLAVNSDIFFGVAEHIEPNPLVYVRLGQVCSHSRLVFSQDHLWRRLCPYSVEGNIKVRFLERIRAYPDFVQEEIYMLWRSLELGHTIEADQSLHYQQTNLDLILPFAICTARFLLPLASHAQFRLKTEYAFQQRPFALVAVHLQPDLYGYLEHFVNDREIVLAAVTERGDLLSHTRGYFQDDDEVVSRAVANCGVALLMASDRLCDHYDIVKQAVQNDGRAMMKVSSRLRDDREIVLAAVTSESSNHCMAFASERLRSDKQICLRAVEHNWESILFVAPTMLDDVDVVTAAVTTNGKALGAASQRLRADYNVVYRAVLSSGLALRHASTELQNNPFVVFAAFVQDIHALVYTDLKRDTGFVCDATLYKVRRGVTPLIQEYVDEYLRWTSP